VTIELLAPALFALASGALGGRLRRRLPPRAAVVLLTLAAVGSAAAVVWALVLITIGGLIGIPAVLDQLGWCRTVLNAGHEAPPAVAAAAAVLLAFGAGRAVAFERGWRRTLRLYGRAGEAVSIIDVEAPIAFAVPGKGGTVVVSRGLLGVLAPSERAALFAHEHCHLQRRHHLYLRAAGLAAAAVPLLLPLARHVRFATEREADEAAAAATGDRRAVARAIAAAVAARPASTPAMALGDHGVTHRVHELLYPRTAAWLPLVPLMAGLAATLVILFSSSLQLHHLLVFGAHICRIG